MTKPVQHKTTDTLRQALATLAALMDRTINEVNVLDSEIQDGIRQAVKETEETLQKQAQESQKLAVDEAIEKTRTAISEEFFSEMQRITDECARANEAVAKAKEAHLLELTETEDAAAIALERQVARAVDRVRSETGVESAALRSELDRANQMLAESKAEFHRVASEKESAQKDVTDKLREELEKAVANAERTRLLLADAELKNSQVIRDAQEATESAAAAHKKELAESVAAIRTELTEERDRLSRQLDELLHTAAQWDAEREKLKEEIKRGAAAMEQAVAAAKKEVAVSSTVATESVKSEVTRVEESIQTISAIIDAPETELTLVIRKNVERAELEAYLRGIRFAISGK